MIYLVLPGTEDEALTDLARGVTVVHGAPRVHTSADAAVEEAARIRKFGPVSIFKVTVVSTYKGL